MLLRLSNPVEVQEKVNTNQAKYYTQAAMEID